VHVCDFADGILSAHSGAENENAAPKFSAAYMASVLYYSLRIKHYKTFSSPLVPLL